MSAVARSVVHEPVSLSRPERSHQVLKSVPEFLQTCLQDEAGHVFAAMAERSPSKLKEWIAAETFGALGHAQEYKIGALLVYGLLAKADTETLNSIFEAARYGLPGSCGDKRIIAAGFFALGRIVPGLEADHPMRKQTEWLAKLYDNRTRGQDQPDCLAAKWALEQIKPSSLSEAQL